MCGFVETRTLTGAAISTMSCFLADGLRCWPQGSRTREISTAHASGEMNKDTQKMMIDIIITMISIIIII